MKLIWRAPRTRAEALTLLRCAGAMLCQGWLEPSLACWLLLVRPEKVLEWFTAYGNAMPDGVARGDHALDHAFEFMTESQPRLRRALHHLAAP